jgi:hypothetical protein
MRKTRVLTAGFAVVAIVGTMALSAWWWVQSEMDAAFVEEIDVALGALNELRTSTGSTAVEDLEILRAIEEHESTLDVFALTLAELRGDSSDDAKAALARIRDYRQKYPRTTVEPELDALVQRALGSKLGGADDR